MSYLWGSAYNRLTGERMERPKFPRYADFPHLSEWLPAYYQYVSDLKRWEAFLKGMPAEYRYERPKLVHATEKGVPVPHLRSGGRRKYKNGAGVSANSRILPHRYADEGEKGQGHRREIRRKERAMWVREWQQEQEQEDAYSVAAWYGNVYGEEDTEAYADTWDDDGYCDYCGGPCEL